MYFLIGAPVALLGLILLLYPAYICRLGVKKGGVPSKRALLVVRLSGALLVLIGGALSYLTWAGVLRL